MSMIFLFYGNTVNVKLGFEKNPVNQTVPEIYWV